MQLVYDLNPYYFKVLMFLGSACHSADTFLNSFLKDPTTIKNFYVPFVQDFKVHTGY